MSEKQINAKVGERLKDWRKSHPDSETGRPMTTKSAAEAVGVNKVTWGRWEAGWPIDIRLLDKISALTGLSRAELRPDFFGGQ